MGLYEYKARVMAILLKYKPKTPKEAEYIDVLMRKINIARTKTLSRFLMDIYHMRRDPKVSEEFRKMLNSIIPTESELEAIQKGEEYE